MYGQSCIGRVAGFCSYVFTPILPCFGFAAGAMIFVVVEEVIPETQQDNNDIATMVSLGIYCYDGLGCCFVEILMFKDY
jgi:ZIP family zinc transporter